MKRFFMGTAAAFAVSTAMAADDPKKPDPPKPPETAEKKADDKRTPIEKFKETKKLLDETEKKARALVESLREKGAEISQENKELVAAFEPLQKLSEQLQEYALVAGKADPASKDGADALYYIFERSLPGYGNDEFFKLFLKHHPDDIRIGKFLLSASSRMPMTPEFEKVLNEVRDRTKNDENQLAIKVARGMALLKFEKTADEGEKLLLALLDEKKDAKLFDKTITKLLEGPLYVHRYLSVGKSAPEIDGEDVDGVKFKLSDYKGKVVMLDFWGHW